EADGKRCGKTSGARTCGDHCSFRIAEDSACDFESRSVTRLTNDIGPSNDLQRLCLV
ncbi:hypothetical protein BgiMline_021871, partial [Biomphalaria glabrata]